MPGPRPSPIDTSAATQHTRSYSTSSTISSANRPSPTSSTAHSSPLRRTTSSLNSDRSSPTATASHSSPLRRTPSSLSRSSLSRQRTHTHTTSISTPLSLNLTLMPPSVLEMWILCRQVGYFYTFFIDTITTPTLDPSRPKIHMKNLMYAQSERALTIARDFATRTHHNISYYDLGQRKLSSDWAICDAPSYEALFCLCCESSAAIFGPRLGNRIDFREIYVPPYVPASQVLSDWRRTGIQPELHEALIKAMAVNMEDWEARVRAYIMGFDPFRPLDAVRLMMETAKELSCAARAVVRLVEHHYRLMLGLVPIEGVSEAKRAYEMGLAEEGDVVERELERGLEGVVAEVEDEMCVLREEKRDSLASVSEEF